MNVEASFIRSAVSASDLPRDGLAELALVGRSNVGKSSLINALVRQRIARTSAAPGKTRLANIYRVTRGGNAPLYLVDLPGYGYARGGAAAAAEFEALAGAYFGTVRPKADTTYDTDVRSVRLQPDRDQRLQPDRDQRLQLDREVAALLLVDARHPGLDSDRAAWQWLTAGVERCAVVATKIDKLARGERIRALRELESVLEASVLPVSAVTGEGLDELWTLIDRLPNNRSPRPRNSSPLPRGTARPPRRPRRKS